MLTDKPINFQAKFHGPSRDVLMALVRGYNGEPLPLDPGAGPIKTSYRLPRELLREKANLAGEAHPSVFLRRLLWKYFQEQRKAIPASASSIRPVAVAQTQRPQPVALPKGSGRIELDVEQVKEALWIKAGRMP